MKKGRIWHVGFQAANSWQSNQPQFCRPVNITLVHFDESGLEWLVWWNSTDGYRSADQTDTQDLAQAPYL